MEITSKKGKVVGQFPKPKNQRVEYHLCTVAAELMDHGHFRDWRSVNRKKWFKHGALGHPDLTCNRW